MAGRIRTAKTRAQRIDMEYFKRPHPFRRWRLWLSLGIPAAALLWIAASASAGSRAPFSSGPVAAAHAVFGQRCERCHVRQAGAFRAHTSDQACLSCHDAPAHKANQTFTPACGSCHADHRGRVRLAEVADGRCEQCHASLRTTDNRVTIAEHVGPLRGSHPEFAAKRPGVRDRTALRFNHAVHLKKDLRGPDGPTTLACATCHVEREARRASGAVRKEQPPRGGLMARVTYAQHCASCHPLYFDPLVDAQAPHDTTDKVRAAVVAALGAFIAAHPDQIGRPDPARGRIPVNFPAPFPSSARNAAEWLAMRSAAVERLLWNKTCAECHVLERAQGSAPPREVPTNAPQVWMPRARFDHRPHRLAACATCHAAETSRETSDVLMPSIDTCRACHKETNGARSGCFECHQYHDWTKARTDAPGHRLADIVN